MTSSDGTKQPMRTCDAGFGSKTDADGDEDIDVRELSGVCIVEGVRGDPSVVRVIEGGCRPLVDGKYIPDS